MSSLRTRRRATLQAVQWLNRLETAECADELRPTFEAWLRERPENLDRYLVLLRARGMVDELRLSCPKEGTRAADQLLQRLANARKDHQSRRARTQSLLIVIAVIVSIVALIWVARRFW